MAYHELKSHMSGGACALLVSANCATSRKAPSTFTASFALVSMYEMGWILRKSDAIKQSDKIWDQNQVFRYTLKTTYFYVAAGSECPWS